MTKKIFSFLNDGETSEENQRHHSIENSMLYRTVRKEKREIVKNCVEKGKKKNFVQFSSLEMMSDEENLQFSQ